jgi:hypothetical protein
MRTTAILLVVVLASLAQEPRGAIRLKFGNANSQHYNRSDLVSEGAAWAMADESNGEVPSMYGLLQNFQLSGGPPTPITCGGVKCSIAFNGTSDLLYISDAPENSPTATFSATVFAKVNSVKDQALIGKWGGGSNSMTIYFIGAGQEANCYVVQSDGATTATAGTTSTFTVGVWQSWTCVADGAFVRLYKNGVPVGNVASYNGTIAESYNSLVVGSLGAAIGWLDGQVAFTGFRKRVMSPQDVSQSYKSVRTRLCGTFTQTGAGTFCSDLPQLGARPAPGGGTQRIVKPVKKIPKKMIVTAKPKIPVVR